MEIPPPGAPKDAWRSWSRGVRRELDWPSLSAAVAARLLDWGGLQGPLCLLTFLPMEGEIHLVALYDRLPRAELVLPRVPGPGDLTLHPLASSLERHPFGFVQPVADSARIEPQKVDVALLPGLAFDWRGVRLGKGSGHFDRLLAHLRSDALRVGVVPAALVVPELPMDEHDQLMTHLATEEGVSRL